MHEQGEAAPVDAMWWVYTTTQASPRTARVIAVAEDLAGHVGQRMVIGGETGRRMAHDWVEALSRAGQAPTGLPKSQA